MSVDLDEFRIKQEQPTAQHKSNAGVGQRNATGLFIRGPVPVAWVRAAAELPGKSPLILGLAIRHQAGLLKTDCDVRITGSLLAKFGLERRTARIAMHHLESAGLVTVERPPGKCRLVTIVDIE